jgi:very-short-patch-repair endonuclease
VTELYNRHSEKVKRQILRNNMPQAERVLWQKIKGRQLLGCKFRRQYSVGVFVIDFYVIELKLALEIDGSSHLTPEAREYDLHRERFLESAGIQVIRFTNSQVYDELDDVLKTISSWIERLQKLALF